MRHHRQDLLPDIDLQPTHPVPYVPVEVQAASMRALRAIHNEIPLGYQKRDGQMTAWALSNSVSREDMAIATVTRRSRRCQRREQDRRLQRCSAHAEVFWFVRPLEGCDDLSRQKFRRVDPPLSVRCHRCAAMGRAAWGSGSC
jgi:hypothetical protein